MKKHILCLGDSNTYGYCVDPEDCADGGNRFNEEERWTCLLQNALGNEYLVIEEGLCGRTTVFPDPPSENMDAMSMLFGLLKSHESIDLLIIMLGTNDAAERFHATAEEICDGMEQLVQKAVDINCWAPGEKPNILVIAPPPAGQGADPESLAAFSDRSRLEKTPLLAELYEKMAKDRGIHFLDAVGCEFNRLDYFHLTKKGHHELADRLITLVPTLI